MSPGDMILTGCVLHMLSRAGQRLRDKCCVRPRVRPLEETHGEVTLTVGEVGGRQTVTEEHAVGLGHLQVDHVRGVL